MVVPIACKFPGYDDHNSTEITAETTQSVETLETNLNNVLENIPAGSEFQIEMSEQQLTSYVSSKLQEDPDSQIHDVQVFLREGEIRVLAMVDQSNMTVQAEMIIKPYLDNTNVIQYEITRAKLGPFNIPQSMINSMREQIGFALDEQLHSLGDNYHIDNITTQNGVMIIKGLKK